MSGFYLGTLVELGGTGCLDKTSRTSVESSTARFVIITFASRGEGVLPLHLARARGCSLSAMPDSEQARQRSQMTRCANCASSSGGDRRTQRWRSNQAAPLSVRKESNVDDRMIRAMRPLSAP